MEAFSEGTWQREAYNDFKSVLLDEDLVFPCIYATKGFKTDDQLYLFIDSDDLSDPRHIRSLATARTAYMPQAHGPVGPNSKEGTAPEDSRGVQQIVLGAAQRHSQT
jgi:FPC/CPF motif-containing protein YcgG